MTDILDKCITWNLDQCSRSIIKTTQYHTFKTIADFGIKLTKLTWQLNYQVDVAFILLKNY